MKFGGLGRAVNRLSIGNLVLGQVVKEKIDLLPQELYFQQSSYLINIFQAIWTGTRMSRKKGIKLTNKHNSPQ